MTFDKLDWRAGSLILLGTRSMLVLLVDSQRWFMHSFIQVFGLQCSVACEHSSLFRVMSLSSSVNLVITVLEQQTHVSSPWPTTMQPRGHSCSDRWSPRRAGHRGSGSTSALGGRGALEAFYAWASMPLSSIAHSFHLSSASGCSGRFGRERWRWGDKSCSGTGSWVASWGIHPRRTFPRGTRRPRKVYHLVRLI